MKTRPLVLALAATLLALTVSCGVDATDQAGSGVATTTPSGDGKTTATTAPDDDGSETTAPDDDGADTTAPGDDEPTTTEPTDEPDAPDAPDDGGPVDEDLLNQFLALGMSQEQAECAATAISNLGISADDFENGVPDPTAIDPDKLDAYIDDYTACFGIDTGGN